jgi:hypothetical protein
MPKRTRNRPVASIDGVNVLLPTSSSEYFRLTWVEPDGRANGTTAGKTLAKAIEAAEKKADRLRRAAEGRSDAPLSLVVAEYTKTGMGRHQRKRKNGAPADWTQAQRTQVEAHLARAVVGNEDVPAYMLDRPMLDRMRARAGTTQMVKENTIALRGLLRWGQSHGYFSVAQSELLPARCAPVDPALRVQGTRPPRQTTARMVGQHDSYVPDEDAPPTARIMALADAFQERAHWGRLAVELAPACGLRWAEQYQLRADDVEVRFTDGRCQVFVRIDWQINSAAKRRGDDPLRVLPKGDKRRLVKVVGTTITGYRLADALIARAAEARAEHEAGTNPDMLLFPTVAQSSARRSRHKGGLYIHTSWSRDMFVPAGLAAGWEVDRWIEIGLDGSRRERLQFRQTWHSLRHRYARTAIDVWHLHIGELMAQGGWENMETVFNRYYRSGSENWESSCAKIPD